jgi:hypothetical protein
VPRPFAPIPLTAKCALQWFDSISSTTIVNVMHAKVSASPSTPNLNDVGDAFEAFGVAITNNVSPTGVTWEGVTVTDLNSSTGPQVVRHLVTATGAGAHGAAGPCALLKLNTALRGRTYRGRVYIGPLVETAVALNQIAPGTASAITAAYDTLETTLLGLTPISAVVIASRKLLTSTAVSARSVEPTPAYQRRRGSR